MGFRIWKTLPTAFFSVLRDFSLDLDWTCRGKSDNFEGEGIDSFRRSSWRRDLNIEGTSMSEDYNLLSEKYIFNCFFRALSSLTLLTKSKIIFEYYV